MPSLLNFLLGLVQYHFFDMKNKYKYLFTSARKYTVKHGRKYEGTDTSHLPNGFLIGQEARPRLPHGISGQMEVFPISLLLERLEKLS